MSTYLDTWKYAGETGDAALASTALSADVEFVSPLTDQFRFLGRGEVEQLLGSVFQVLRDVRYTGDLRQGRHAYLTTSATVRGVPLQDLQQITLDDEGRVAHIVIAMRPLPAVTAFVRAVGPVVARQQGRRGVARTLTVAGAFLDSVASSGDKSFIPLAAPDNARR